MGLFAAAPFLGPVLGPIVGGFLSEYGASSLLTNLIPSELEMDLLVCSNICICRVAGHCLLTP